MSKKMMKRSLALGALMAFVITGSAMAADFNSQQELEGAEVSFEGKTFTCNSLYGVSASSNYGGAIKSNVDLNLNGCTFEQNSLKRAGEVRGGAVYVWSGKDLQVDNTKFISNFVENTSGRPGTGGAIHFGEGTTATIKNSHFEGNKAIDANDGSDMGGAIYFSNNLEKGYIVENCKFIKNAGAEGGAFVTNHGEVTVIDSYFEGNEAPTQCGGAINIQGYGDKGIGKVILNSSADGVNEFKNNKAKQNGGAIMVYGPNSLDINGNANFTGNKAGVTIDEDGNVSGGYANDIHNDGTVNINKGADVTLNGGMTGSGIVNVNGILQLGGAISGKEVTFGADSKLVLLGDGDQFTKEYAVNGKGDGATLTVTEGAKLEVVGIKNNTYNIAKDFTNIKDAEDKFDVTNLNALMQGEWSATKEDGLQLKVSAKEASDMADDTGISTSTAGLVQSIINGADSASTPEQEAAVEFIENVLVNNNNDPEAVGNAINAATKMGEAGGNSATAASIVKNVTGVTNDRLSFNCGHSAPHKGGHGVGLFEEGSGADIWVEYVHGKDEVEDMPSTAGKTSYEGQYNGIVMGVDFKKVNKFQSGIAFNYGEGDTNSLGSSVRTHSDYDFWGVGYYGNIHNDDSNVIFDINYAKTDSDVTQYNSGSTLEASPETTTWSAGVKLEKLYQNENVQIVPYTGLRYMSIDADDYSTSGGEFYYSMDRQDIWLLPVGVSIRQEVANDNGWTVSPRVDLSYIWAFGDTNSNMEVKSPFPGVSQIGYDVMDDGSFLGLVGIEAHKGQWGYGVAYSYQKGDHSESKKWYVDVNYSF